MGKKYMANVESIKLFWRAANYLSVGMLYLKNNPILHKEVQFNHFKKNIYGHWGTCPGINAIYAHVSDLIRRTGKKMRLVVGTGHAGSALLSCLFLEGTLEKFYPEMTRNLKGIEYLFNSYESSFPTEISSCYPGVLYSGGELGAALAFTQGYAMNNPDSCIVCIIGDGELETSITQASWQGFNILSKRKDGKVLPVVNANGFKMGSKSIYALKSHEEYECILKGYGLSPIFVGENHVELANAFNIAYTQLFDTCSENQPIIFLNCPKGWSAPKMFGHIKFENSYNSHKPILKNPSRNIDELNMVKEWLLSYIPRQLFDKKGCPYKEVVECLPKLEHRLGLGHYIKKTYFDNSRNKKVYKSIMDAVSKDLIVKVRNNDNLLIFSPDELESNRFGDILKITKLKYSNIEDDFYSENGKVIEILNEHLCFAWSQGYVTAGKYPIVISYEAFAPIFDSLATQYIKYLKGCKDISWRNSCPSINIILTSLGWYNTPTHHNPCFIDNFIGRKLENMRIYMPVLPESSLDFLGEMLKSNDRINVMVFNKRPLKRLSKIKISEKRVCKSWVELEGDIDGYHKITIIAIGDCMTEEALIAKAIINAKYPNCMVRVIAIEDLYILENSSHSDWNGLINESSCCVWVYNGYAKSIKSLLWDMKIFRKNAVLCYNDNDQTSAGEDRLKINNVSGNDIAREAVKMVGLNLS